MEEQQLIAQEIIKIKKLLSTFILSWKKLALSHSKLRMYKNSKGFLNDMGKYHKK